MDTTHPSAGVLLTIGRWAAFTSDPDGGNPAGVVLDASPVAHETEAMRAIAADVGYSETAFVTDGPVRDHRRAYAVRYFAPQAEVPFCGHATIALAVAVGRVIGPGPLHFTTAAGTVRVDVDHGSDGWQATLQSPEPSHEPMSPELLGALLATFGWTRQVLDPRTPPAVAYAGARHAVLPLRNRTALADMSYDYDALRSLSLEQGWVTIHLAVAESPTVHHVRAPFPFGGVVEDPATGAGAAAYAAYLRDIGRIPIPTALTIHQGVDMGRPSLLLVDVGMDGPIRVTGQAVPIGLEP